MRTCGCHFGRSDLAIRGKGAATGCRAEVGNHHRYDHENDRSPTNAHPRSSMAVVIGRIRPVEGDGSAGDA